MAVIRIAMQRLGVQHELAALGYGDRGDDRDLAAELVRRPGLAFADALYLGGVQRVDLRAALTRLLLSHTRGKIEQWAEAIFEHCVAIRSGGGCPG